MFGASGPPGDPVVLLVGLEASPGRQVVLIFIQNTVQCSINVLCHDLIDMVSRYFLGLAFALYDKERIAHFFKLKEQKSKKELFAPVRSFGKERIALVRSFGKE